MNNPIPTSPETFYNFWDFLYPTELQRIVYSMPWWQVFLAAFIGFSFIYFSLAGLGFFYGRVICRRLGYGQMIEHRPLFKGQIWWEIKHSFLSIAIFALYGVATVAVDKSNLLPISWQIPNFFVFLLDVLILSLWNELHFYFIHRGLHHPWWFKKVHQVHHKSITTTPFATYSFHWVESTALSSVMITGMAVMAVFGHSFNIYVLIVFPLVSLMMNTIGHLNFTLFPEVSINSVAAASRRHAGHHKFLRGNYGFLLPYLDRWFGTRLKD